MLYYALGLVLGLLLSVLISIVEKWAMAAPPGDIIRPQGKDRITPAERLQLIGLLALADRNARQMEEIRASVQELLGTTNGHIDDAIWEPSRRDADGLLDRLKITVEGN